MCEWGKSKPVLLAYPRDITGRRTVYVDECIATLIQALNDAGFHTLGACCGHGKEPASIILQMEGQDWVNAKTSLRCSQSRNGASQGGGLLGRFT